MQIFLVKPQNQLIKKKKSYYLQTRKPGAQKFKYVPQITYAINREDKI